MKAATRLSYSIVPIYRISIHAAREGGDKTVRILNPYGEIFQSTPPVKAATDIAFYVGKTHWISIHAAREGGDWLPPSYGKTSYISIHAAREGGDYVQMIRCNFKLKFQSTPPVKAATDSLHLLGDDIPISIHAAREGGDAANTYTDTVCSISIHAAREGGDSVFQFQ